MDARCIMHPRGQVPASSVRFDTPGPSPFLQHHALVCVIDESAYRASMLAAQRLASRSPLGLQTLARASMSTAPDSAWRHNIISGDQARVAQVC